MDHATKRDEKKLIKSCLVVVLTIISFFKIYLSSIGKYIVERKKFKFLRFK